MYKEREKQKEAQRRWIAEKRAKMREKIRQDAPGSTKSVEPDVNVEPVLSNPVNYGQADCQCQHCQQNRRAGSNYRINHGPRKKIDELEAGELNRVSLPGDPDYDGVVLKQGQGKEYV